ncbi:thioredoxin family protein [Streptococcus pneumoniae 2070335]|nr:thioredoxin family protein [Streptococcus pneumoniae 2070335]
MRRKSYDTASKFRRISIFSGKSGQEGLPFVADWCGDCRYIYPALPEIEETNPEFTFIRMDRDQYMDLAKLWDVYGIPSLVVLEKDKEIGRFVNRDRKSKEQINDFLAGLK